MSFSKISITTPRRERAFGLILICDHPGHKWAIEGKFQPRCSFLIDGMLGTRFFWDRHVRRAYVWTPRRRNWKHWRSMHWRSFERDFRPSLVNNRLFLNQLKSKINRWEFSDGKNAPFCDFNQKWISWGGVKLVALRPSPNILCPSSEVPQIWDSKIFKKIIFRHMYYDPTKGTSFRAGFIMGPSRALKSLSGKVTASLLLPVRLERGDKIMNKTDKN